MKGKICGFKRSRHGVDTRFCIIESGEAALEQCIGKKVFWKSAKGRVFRGRVVKRHGREAFLCKFEKAVPADALGGTIAIGRMIPEKIAKVEKPKKEKPKKVAKKPVKKEAKPEKKAKAVPKKAAKPAKKPVKKAAPKTAKKPVKKAPAKKAVKKKK